MDMDGGWTWGLGICCSALLIAVLMGPSLVGRIFSWAPLRYIGMISYSLYVWHMLVIEALTALKVSHHSYFLLTGSTWIVLLFVGSLSYRYIERPFLTGRVKRAGLETSAASGGYSGLVSRLRTRSWRANRSASCR